VNAGKTALQVSRLFESTVRHLYMDSKASVEMSAFLCNLTGLAAHCAILVDYATIFVKSSVKQKDKFIGEEAFVLGYLRSCQTQFQHIADRNVTGITRSFQVVQAGVPHEHEFNEEMGIPVALGPDPNLLLAKQQLPNEHSIIEDILVDTRTLHRLIRRPNVDAVPTSERIHVDNPSIEEISALSRSHSSKIFDIEGLDEIPDELELTLEPVEAPLLRSQHESSVPTANDARKPWLLAETRDPIASAGADAHSESGSDGISDRSYATALS